MKVNRRMTHMPQLRRVRFHENFVDKFPSRSIVATEFGKNEMTFNILVVMERTRGADR